MMCWDQQVTPRGRRAGPGQQRAGAQGGFTLLEVILAIFIVMGMLTVVLYFYQQAARLRTDVLVRTDEVAGFRLLMDRMTTELRQAFAGDALTGGLTGTSNSISFLREAMPDLSSWSGDDETNVVQPSWDLARISYSLRSSMDPTNVLGVERVEEPLLEAVPEAVSTEEAVAETEAIDWMFFEGLGTEDKPEATEAPPEEPEELPSGRSMLAEQVRFLRFRFWDGQEWLESWAGSGLPAGVEISLGAAALPAETIPEEYPDELYRRVVYLPGSGALAGAGSAEGLEKPPGSEPDATTGAMEEGLLP